MKKLMITVATLLSLVLAPLSALAEKGGDKGPDDRAYDRASDNASFNRDHDDRDDDDGEHRKSESKHDQGQDTIHQGKATMGFRTKPVQ